MHWTVKEKKLKTTDINRDEKFSEEKPSTTFWTINGMKKFWNS